MDSNSHTETGAMPSRNAAQLALDIFNLLEPYPSEMRQKAVQSALMALGENAVSPRAGATHASFAGTEDFSDVKIGPKALKWLQKYTVTRAMLDEVFHMTDGGIDISANSVPGASKREMTVNCYLLTGLRHLIAHDDPTFDESEAIAVCKRLTAYDRNNHTTNRNAVGNKMSGTKPKFTLTGPGETAAAELVKQMASPARG